MNGIHFPAVVRVQLWHDPLVERIGFPVHGPYLESVWLPVVGPSAAWGLRCLNGWAAVQPDGVDVDLAELGEALGLTGQPSAKTAPLQRTLLRLVRFGLAEWSGTLRVRSVLPPVSQRHLQRLSPRIQQSHDRFVAAQTAA